MRCLLFFVIAFLQISSTNLQFWDKIFESDDLEPEEKINLTLDSNKTENLAKINTGTCYICAIASTELASLFNISSSFR